MPYTTTPLANAGFAGGFLAPLRNDDAGDCASGPENPHQTVIQSEAMNLRGKHFQPPVRSTPNLATHHTTVIPR